MGKGSRRSHTLETYIGRHFHCVAFQELAKWQGERTCRVIRASSRMVRVDSGCSVALLGKQWHAPVNAHLAHSTALQWLSDPHPPPHVGLHPQEASFICCWLVCVRITLFGRSISCQLPRVGSEERLTVGGCPGLRPQWNEKGQLETHRAGASF